MALFKRNVQIKDKIDGQPIHAPLMSEGGYGQGNSIQRISQILRQKGVQATVYSRPLVVDGNKVDRSDYQIKQWLKSLN
ncbi:MAG: hypothetical protein SPE36_10855 [Lactobacillus johnsonii]|nr:hypothetical protein [Limosilactobacillus reuteri]MDY4502378.1 hypothetical protein [Lactobacillus johnsonii]